MNTSPGLTVVKADQVAAFRNRTLSNLLATPHVGNVSHDLHRRFYQDAVDNIRQWLDRQSRDCPPCRQVSPPRRTR